MSERAERGFTLVEVLIAIVLLTIGVMALVGSSAMVTRMIGRGRTGTYVAQKASSRFDKLRQIAAGTSPACGSGSFVSGTSTDAVAHTTETWTVPTTGNSRLITVIVSYKTPTHAYADTAKSYILCK